MKITPLYLVAILIPTVCWPTALARVHVETLFDHAAFVGIVVVEEGRMISNGDYPCGALYSGRVEHQFKGRLLDDIEFGYFHGYEIGSRYLLFLTEPEEEFRVLTSTNSMALSAEAEARRECGPLRTGHAIMHEGYGALSISWASEFSYQNAVRVLFNAIQFPGEIRSAPVSPGSRERSEGVILIPEQDVIEYLSGLE